MMQAEKDLWSARNSLATEDFEWACFQAQQSAEGSALRERCATDHHPLGLRVAQGDRRPGASSLPKGCTISGQPNPPTASPAALPPVNSMTKEDAEECINAADHIVRAARSLVPI
ncbi:HEPN domain-containing protein [Methanofollis formosanus]|uniref:HEPN domain-containing protein n=1 Tax=Methanofollis formosanus TaxID=299308 RepID=UPI002484A9AE|nr:HEPN domain-containing protein [Methanofollis formosanus]